MAVMLADRAGRRGVGETHPSADVKHDLAERRTVVQELERLGSSLERKMSTDYGADSTRVDQPVHRGADLAPDIGLAHYERAPARAHHLGVVQQQPVHLDLGDRATGETNDEGAAALAQRTDAVGEAVAAHRVEHDIYAAPGELFCLVLPRTIGTDAPLGAGGARNSGLLVGGHDADRPGTEALRDLERGGADATRSAVDQH